MLKGEGYAIPFISTKLFHFFVNLAKTRTDITFEIRGDSTGSNVTATIMIENISDVLLLVVLSEETKGDIQ